MKNILITGISGKVGSVITAKLKEKYNISGVDLKKSNLVSTTIADCTNLDKILPAFKGIDVVIDLASDPNQYSDWNVIHDTNLLCTSTALEASRISGVKRFIFASSNHATGMYEFDSPYKEIVEGEYSKINKDNLPLINTEMPIRPDGPYGIGKAFGEASGRYYSDKYDISVICLRIGTLNSESAPTNIRQFATLLTHNDLGRLITACVEAPKEIRFGIYYGVSNNKWKFWDTSNSSKDLNYQPEDDAELFR
ncbi:MAG: hypothetical protein CL748_02575 [Chloroflexi bacterium]|nr:hypothetical protein [Chloroflexota bacterium]